MDVVVIGGGLIGLATAWRLRQSGLHVSVWEAGRTGSEASWAGAGMLAPGGEFDRPTWWGNLARESLALYPGFVRELASESESTIDYRACGALEFAGSEDEWRTLGQRVRSQRAWGMTVEDAGANQFYYPDDAAVNPRDLLNALRTACQRRGVTIREGEPVRQIVSQAGRITLPESAEAAVLAAGAWSSSISIVFDGVRLELETSIPIRGHLIAFAPPSEQPGPILRRGHTYILQRSDGLTIAGSTTEQVGFHREPDPALFHDVERRARELMPSLEQAPRVAEWIGFRPGTVSGEPQLRRLADSPIYLAYGHYRNGILMAPRTASFLADLINANLRTGSASPTVHR